MHMQHAKEKLNPQTTFPFDDQTCDDALTGDRTRIARLTVPTWSALPSKVRTSLRLAIGTFERSAGRGTLDTTIVTRKLRWSRDGVTHVVDGGHTQSEVIAKLMGHKVEFTQRAEKGRWVMYGSLAVLRYGNDLESFDDLLSVALPVFAHRDGAWRRWPGAPMLWRYDRALLSQIAMVCSIAGKKRVAA